MTQKSNHLQDLFLARAQRDKLGLTLFLMTGFQVRGSVAGFDAFTVVLMTEGKQQVIYKHAISTMVPERPVALNESL